MDRIGSERYGIFLNKFRGKERRGKERNGLDRRG